MTDKSNAYQWRWDFINEVWIRVPAFVTTKRLTDAGLVVAGVPLLYWINANPGVASSAFELTDDDDGSTGVVFDHFDTTRDGHVIPLSPPMRFENGIYVKTFTNMTSLVFGYTT